MNANSNQTGGGCNTKAANRTILETNGFAGEPVGAILIFNKIFTVQRGAGPSNS